MDFVGSQDAVVTETSYKLHKTGRVSRVAEEKYLHSSVPCGFACCGEERLRPGGAETGLGRHVLVPDAALVLDHLALLEEGLIKNFVLTQTLLDAAREASRSVYRKLLKLIERDRLFVFANEFFKDTYTSDQNAKYSAVAQWYTGHFPGNACPFYVLTSGPAPSNSPNTLAVEEYLEYLPDKEEAKKIIARVKAGGEVEYPRHLDRVEIGKGLANGLIFRGPLNTERYNSAQGKVSCMIEGKQMDVHIIGRESMNRAIHGDAVYFELVQREEPLAESLEEDEAGGGPMESEPKRPKLQGSCSVQDSSRLGGICGRVVGIESRGWRQYCCTVDENSIEDKDGPQMAIMIPLDKHIPKIRIKSTQATDLRGQVVVVQICDWAEDSFYPAGYYVKRIGAVGDTATEMNAIIIENGIVDRAFREASMGELPPETWALGESDLEGREDLRGLVVMSIDPEGCIDIDDALHCRALPGGAFEVGVHIADVTHFVESGSHLDAESKERGCTVYLVGRRIDMLPPLLGTNLCSLHSGADRLAFSVIWKMDGDGNVLERRFCRTVIKSRRSFTYEQARDVLMGNRREPEEIEGSLRALDGIARRLRSGRLRKGALVLASSDFRVKAHAKALEENKKVDEVAGQMEIEEDAGDGEGGPTDTHSLVEEFMLLANTAVAQRIVETFPSTSLLRVHPAPAQEAFSELKRQLEGKAYSLDTRSAMDLGRSLDEIRSDNLFFNKLVRILVTRCMTQAVYCPSGDVGDRGQMHYGLAADLYTHFTSPIRRYADIVVHRLLWASISRDCAEGGVAGQAGEADLRSICKNINYRNRMAKAASRQSNQLYAFFLFKSSGGEAEAYAIKLLSNGAVFYIPAYGLEGVAYLGDGELENAVLRSGALELRIFDRRRVRLNPSRADEFYRNRRIVLDIL